MRLIDADALKDEFCAHCATLKRYKRTVEECRSYIDPDGNGCFKMRYIDSSPTVDAVPVVRCKDCNYSGRLVGGDTYCKHIHGLNYPRETDFCSHGKLKEATPC